MIDTNQTPMFSRSSIGRNRWYWIVFEDWGCDPIAQGIARSPEDALAEAVRRCGPVDRMAATHAKGRWKRQRVLARQQAVAEGDDAQADRSSQGWWDNCTYYF